MHISLAPNSATMDDFHALLRTLMSPDNASRQQAEQAYDGVKQQNPGMLLSCLAQTVRSCADATLRAFGAEARKLVSQLQGLAGPRAREKPDPQPNPFFSSSHSLLSKLSQA